MHVRAGISPPFETEDSGRAVQLLKATGRTASEGDDLT